MASSVFCVIVFALVSTNLIFADHELNSDGSPNRRRTGSNSVSEFFSELGDLFLDVDRAISVQTAPKVEYQDSLASEILGPLQPRKEYFGRIQENYKTLQNRLGSLIEETVSPEQGAFNPLRSVLPLKSSDAFEKVETSHSHPRHEVGRASKGRGLDSNTEDNIRKSMEKFISDTRRTNKFISSLGSKVLDEAENVLVRRSGDISDSTNSDSQGRIIGDALYSESRFDRYIRELLKNNGRWVLDNPLFQRLRASRRSRVNTPEAAPESLTEKTEDVTTSTEESTSEEVSTEAFEPSSTESQNKLPDVDYSSEERSLENSPVMAHNYYRVDDDGRLMEEVDIVLEPESEESDEIEGTERYIEDEMESEDEPKETIILAFTPDGVPLKLRMGPEIENPMEYLHNVLRTAGVSLKVPVEYNEDEEDIEPVGNEVMLLGAGTGITRSVALNISNQQELKALVRVLKKNKVPENRK